MRPAPLLLGLVLLALLAAPAAADIYSCAGADGKTLFTTDRSQCPGSPAHELRGQVQHAAASTATLHSSSASAPGRDAQDQAAWRHKKVMAQQAAEKAHAQVKSLEHAVLLCNQGSTLYGVDRETGLKHDIPCDRVDEALAETRARAARADAYLAGGLEEECRRSGCLPGWIR